MAGELGFDSGPYINVAAFCEKILNEQDGVLTAIRFIDQMNIRIDDPAAPDELPPGIIQPTLLIMLKAGKARGKQTVQVVLEAPDGKKTEGPELAVNLSPGPAGGANLVLPMAIGIESEGLYWANVLVNRRLMACVPMTVNYEFRRELGPGPPS